MKIFGYHIHILISKKPVDMKMIQKLKEGKAHLRTNPKRKRKEKLNGKEQGSTEKRT